MTPFRSKLTTLFILAACFITLIPVYADDAIPSHYSLPGAMSHKEEFVAVNPLAGWNRNTVSVKGQGGMPSMKLEDEEAEYGLLLLYVSQRLAVNNITFYTPPHDGEIWGNVASFSIYGKPDSLLTWSAGGSWTWHAISMPGSDMTINAPFLKAGAMIRIPGWPVSINPYAGYGIEYVDASGRNYESDMMLYGVSANTMLHKLHINMKYMLYDDIESSDTFETISFRIIMPVFERIGWSVWAQRMEQLYTRDSSVLTGPVWLF